MPKHFFEYLQKHSNAKIEILDRYYIPWLRKITLGPFNENKCLVIDGFAGEGIYEDGSEGSPIKLIDGAIGLAEQNIRSSRPLPKVTIFLIEGTEEIYKKLYKNILTKYDCKVDENGIINLINYPTIRILIFNDGFENVMNAILDKYEGSLIPSFFFADPFGFSNTPFDIFKRFLKNNKAEILFNFMYEEINRFILSDRSPKLVKTYENLFGVPNLDELREQIADKNAPLRKETIINYYSKQLLEKTEAKYVLNFEFKKRGKTKMFLVYATKNINGLALMKDVMWKVDETGAFLYDDRKSDAQIQFEFFNELTKQEHIDKLSKLIYENFRNRHKVDLTTVERFVLENTIYPLTNYFKPAMVKLEKENFITVIRKNGARKGSFNDKVLYINF